MQTFQPPLKRVLHFGDEGDAKNHVEPVGLLGDTDVILPQLFEFLSEVYFRNHRVDDLVVPLGQSSQAAPYRGLILQLFEVSLLEGEERREPSQIEFREAGTDAVMD